MRQFCPKGHDTFILGRTKKRVCNLCEKSRHRGKAHAEGWRKRQIKNLDGTWFRQVDYDRLYQIQQGRCAMCDLHMTDLGRMLSADHDHETGFIRGLLCPTCNTRLGHYENKLWWNRAAKYLKETSSAV